MQRPITPRIAPAPRITRAAVAALVVVALLPALGAVSSRKNLLRNGDFEKGLTDAGEPVGWHTRITGIIPVPEYRDPQNKKGRTGVYQFKCGCGHDWGKVRPWAMLVCTQCGRLNVGLEDSGDLYQTNERHVKLAERAGSGRAVRFTLPQSVGNNQGVRVVSDLVKARRGAAYEISFDAIAEGSHLRVFVEGFRLMKNDEEAKAWVEDLDPKANPLGQTVRLKRVFRKQINAGTPTQWQRFGDRFLPPKRHEFDFMFVNLYAYLPGKAAYDRVVLRQLSAAETRALRQEDSRRGGRARR